MDFKGSVTWDNFEFGLGIYNLLNSRSLAVGGHQRQDARSAAPTSMTIANRGSSLDQYYFQPSRSFQFTVKARF